MAVIVKNAHVDQNDSRKLEYANRTHTENEITHSEQFAPELFDVAVRDIEEAYMPMEVATAEPERSEPLVFDDKLIYEGKEYYSAELIERKAENALRSKIAELESEKEAWFAEAQERGFQDGIAQAEQTYNDKMSELAELINNIQTAFTVKIEENEELIRKTIFIAICKILGGAVQYKEQRIEMIKNTIEQIAANNPFTLRLSAQDYASLQDNQHLLQLSQDIKIMSDNRVLAGGCIIETDTGTFDGRLEVQLARLKEVIES